MKKNYDRFLCIHGHFYQPPRENPWTGIIHVQKSAYPYHDWNERITRECYAPNTRSRLHGENGYIKKLINNYESISFNFGPTLLSWLEIYNPWVYSQIINADIKSRKKFGGHGNAIAQVYNHIIMPLASERDKITQVKWGLIDFCHRFGRKAEGMWLAETAVNRETLQSLVNEGVKFTILSPFQAHKVREMSLPDSEWKDVSGGKIDCTHPYRCFLSDDKNNFIDIFFYNGFLSKAIAYEKLLSSGEIFLKKILESFPQSSNTPALVNIATDGESYGHHFKFGEMALTWVLETIKNRDDITLTNYGEFLEKCPPVKEVQIFENSAWSCAHGVERWRSNCGCSISQNPGWTQSWRTPLRDGLNWLNNHLSAVFEERTKHLLKDCWEARNNYISVTLAQGEYDKNAFIKKHALKSIIKDEQKEVFQLLESQKMALYMFTSCGWFFDDISGIEAVQVLMYAKKAIELCAGYTHEDLEKGLKDYLVKAVSNDKKYMNGLEVYNKKVLPFTYNMITLSANYALLYLMDQNQKLEWLKTIVKPRNEKIGMAGENTIYYTETDYPDIRDADLRTCALSFKTVDNELKCISGKINKKSLKQIEDIVDGILSGRSHIINLDTFSKYFLDSNIFSLVDMIPDVKSDIVNILSKDLEGKFFGKVHERPEEIYNYIKYLMSAGKAIPDNLINSVQSLATYLFHKLFKYSSSTPINYNEIEYLLGLFEKEPDDEDLNSINKIVFNPVSLLQQQRIIKSIEWFLADQIASIRENNIKLYLNNILNSIVFIQKYKLNPDLWQFQNQFDELRFDMGFIKNLDRDSLSSFRQIEKLLGFEGGN